MAQTILITGASLGIGEACAHVFAKSGARVILSARTESKLLALKSQLEAAYDADVCVLPMDVSNCESVKTAIASLDADWQEIDVLVNNAGLALGLEKVQDAEPADWDRMIDTNIKGVLYVARYVLPVMLARNRGHVINIGSISSHQVYSGGTVYCATKFAVRAISQGIKHDVHGTAIRVTEIDPGMVETDFSNTRFRGDAKKAASIYADFEPLHANDIADAVFYAVNCPAHVDVQQMLVMPTAQTATGLIAKSK